MNWGSVQGLITVVVPVTTSPLLCDFLFQVGVFAPSGVLVPFVAVRAQSPFARAQD